MAQGGCRTFIVHARKAWLEGLSPKENRDVPPIDYDRVVPLKARRPELTIIVNGGIESFSEAAEHLTHVDGVMLGRAAYHDPYLLAEVDRGCSAKTSPRRRGSMCSTASCLMSKRSLPAACGSIR